jgi:DNA-binding response OmpR family regulator
VDSGPAAATGNVWSVHILVATDADYVAADVTAALSGPEVSFTICREGRLVSDLVAEGGVDLAILDLQIGSKGAMAVAMDLRLDESDGRVPSVPVLMLLDRQADVHLAKRSAAEAWLVKPFDAITLKRAVKLVLEGPPPEPPADGEAVVESPADDDTVATEEEPAVAG